MRRLFRFRRYRKIADIIHHTKDIDTAGNEIEQTVRQVLKSKLPELYYVSQGHIIDRNLHYSSQLDVIIADNKGSPILFKAKDGTEYFPYESVYAIGEVKSTYKDVEQIAKFSETLADIRLNLTRDIVTKATIMPQSIASEFIEGGYCKNHLFSFMLFVDSNNFREEAATELFTNTAYSQLPTIICLLNKGLIVNTRHLSPHLKELITNRHEYWPVFLPRDQFEKADNYWVFIECGTDEGRLGRHYGYLFASLINHLKSCILTEPDMLTYMNFILNNAISIIAPSK